MRPVFFLSLIAVVAVGAAFFFYNQYQNTQAEVKQFKEDPKAAAAEDTKKLIEKVGNLVELPTGEDPTVATITDLSRLKDQPFFARAENGDKVLIYTTVKKAYLYRPSTNKILEIAPINIGSPSAQALKLRVALYNGTNTTGLTRAVESDLKGKLTNIEVVLKENAEKKDYAETIVVDLSGIRRDDAEAVAKVLGGKVGALPEGETKPDADLLLIIGSDYEKR